LPSPTAIANRAKFGAVRPGLPAAAPVSGRARNTSEIARPKVGYSPCPPLASLRTLLPLIRAAAADRSRPQPAQTAASRSDPATREDMPFASNLPELDVAVTGVPLGELLDHVCLPANGTATFGRRHQCIPERCQCGVVVVGPLGSVLFVDIRT
jgi:hypothetical protein